MEHALFILENDFWRTEFCEFTKTIVTIDDTTVEIVEIGRCISTTIQLNHRTEIVWKYLKCRKNKAFRSLTTFVERRCEFQFLEYFLLLTLRRTLEFFLMYLDELSEIDAGEECLDMFRSRSSSENLRKFIIENTVIEFSNDDSLLE